MAMDDILAAVMSYRARYVTVTGGEPLAQRSCPALLERLCEAGFSVSLETSGALDISGVDRRVMKVVDFKTPGSGEEARNRYQNIDYLSALDQVKFVICDRRDYQWAQETIRKFDLSSSCEVLFSPAAGEMDAASLADWILADKLPVRFQIQLHKYLWGDVPGK